MRNIISYPHQATSYLIPSRLTESEDHVAASAVSSLVVVVVDEDEGVVAVEHAPVLAEVGETLQLDVAAKSLTKILTILKYT